MCPLTPGAIAVGKVWVLKMALVRAHVKSSGSHRMLLTAIMLKFELNTVKR
jgi:hypothetical protein